MPWHTRLYVLYLLVMIGLIAVRFIKFGWSLHKSRKLANTRSGSDKLNPLWTNYIEKADSLKDFSKLTFLISLLNFSWSAANDLFGLQMQKEANWKITMELIGYALPPFSFGMIVCIALLACGMVIQHMSKNKRPDKL